MPLRWRIALFGAAVVLLTVLLFSLLLYGLAARGLPTQQNEALLLRTQQAIAYLQLAAPEQLSAQGAFVPLNLSTGTDTFLELLDASGNPTWSSGEVDGAKPAIPADLLAMVNATGHAVATLKPQGGKEGQRGVALRVHVQSWSRPEPGLNGYVVAGQPARGLNSSLAGLRTFMLLTALLCLLAALGALWFVLGRALRPLRRMAQAVDAIGSTRDLGRRLPPVQSNDEIGLLTRSFNSMLQRVQEAYERLAGALDAQKRFVADASHELRTPLTTIRNNAGFLLQHADASAHDRQAALEDIAGESDRMTRLVHDLLTLARADAGQQLELTPIDLGVVVSDVARKAQKLHPDRVLLVEGEPSLVVAGNADALTRLLWILIDNATRHTAVGGRIVLRLGRSHDTARLSVADDGAGVPRAERARIFERFYQADSSRSSGGAGLGLAIARWITEQHHGRVSLADGVAPGATFYVEIPTSPISHVALKTPSRQRETIASGIAETADQANGAAEGRS